MRFPFCPVQSHVHSAVTEGGLVNRHTMLRARAWWEGKFREHGAVVNRELVWALQEKNSVLRRDEARRRRPETPHPAASPASPLLCVIAMPGNFLSTAKRRP